MRINSGQRLIEQRSKTVIQGRATFRRAPLQLALDQIRKRARILGWYSSQILLGALQAALYAFERLHDCQRALDSIHLGPSRFFLAACPENAIQRTDLVHSPGDSGE